MVGSYAGVFWRVEMTPRMIVQEPSTDPSSRDLRHCEALPSPRTRMKSSVVSYRYREERGAAAIVKRPILYPQFQM